MPTQYRIRTHPRARRVRLKVLDDASVEVVVPPGCDRQRAARFVAEQAAWIQRAQRRVRERMRTVDPAIDGPWPRRLELAAIGRQIVLQYRIDTGKPVVHPDGDVWTVCLPDRDPAPVPALLVAALKRTARQNLEPRLAELATAAGLEYGRVSWRNQRSRWGSCSARGGLSLNIKLLFLAPDLAEGVLAHELAHLRHPDHSPDFHAFAETIYPGVSGQGRRLATARARLPAWLRAAR